MSFDFRSLKPIRSNWLETRVAYVGRGRAVFTDPQGEIEGPARVTFARSGRAKVCITPETVTPNHFPLHLGRIQGEYRRFGMQNPCASVTVNTEMGIFSSTTDRVFIDNGMFRAEVGQAVDLHPLRSEFVVTNEGQQAAFWVMPLTNFVTDDWCRTECEELISHRLRMFSTPEVPLVLVDDDLVRAQLIANSRQHLLTFCQGGRGGFIEQLPGYEKRVKRLTSRESRKEFTAVIVGPAHVQRVRWDEPHTTFPIDLLALLNLAAGSRVGAPWVEFRTDAGELVRRDHIPFGASGYCTPRPVLRCYHRNAIGCLLDRGFDSGEFGKPYLRVVLHHAAAAAECGTQETQFLTLCRAFETLCRERKLMEQDLSALLSEDQRKAVTDILNEAWCKIRGITSHETDARRKDATSRISDRIRASAQKEKQFGIAVCDLAKHFGLQDAAVLDRHFAAHPSSAGNTWAQVLSHYRGAATHEAYFDIDGRHDLWSTQRVKDHLQDLLLRVIWKLIGYDGPYQTPIPPAHEKPNADWVTPTTSVRELGFE